MNISFENKVTLVTGAGSGLGLATARAFAESGASVVLANRNEEAAQIAAKEITDKGHKALAVRCDVSDDAQVEAMVNQTISAFGRIDAAYNNAGVQNVLAETADTAREDYDRVMGIRSKYGRSPYLKAMIGAHARAATIKIMPRDAKGAHDESA
jgi:NAD(P)-dependent dehydrogenase (short-subunit alcohol dehydrogenase family)